MCLDNVIAGHLPVKALRYHEGLGELIFLADPKHFKNGEYVGLDSQEIIQAADASQAIPVFTKLFSVVPCAYFNDEPGAEGIVGKLGTFAVGVNWDGSMQNRIELHIQADFSKYEEFAEEFSVDKAKAIADESKLKFGVLTKNEDSTYSVAVHNLSEFITSRQMRLSSFK